MNVVKEIERINEREAKLGITGTKASWHERYRSSAWIYAGGLAYKLSEGDVICVFSQWGEIEDIHLSRDEETGKSKGFAFIKYEDQRSTDLAVDNFNGVKLLGKTLRVDHKLDYNAPKKKKEERDGTEGPVKYEPGMSYDGKDLANDYNMKKGVNLYGSDGGSESEEDERKKRKRKKRERKQAKREKKRRKKEKRESEFRREQQVKEIRETAKREMQRLQKERRDTGNDNQGPSWRGRMDPSLRREHRDVRRRRHDRESSSSTRRDRRREDTMKIGEVCSGANRIR